MNVPPLSNNAHLNLCQTINVLLMWIQYLLLKNTCDCLSQILIPHS